MAEANLKSWILSFDELRVLLFSLGFEKNEGILMDEKTFSESEVLRILYTLTQKQLLTIGDGSDFEMKRELKDLLMAVGEPECTEVLKAEDGREFFCYLRAQTAAVTERYWQRKDTVRLTGMSTEQYQEWRQNLR